MMLGGGAGETVWGFLPPSGHTFPLHISWSPSMGGRKPTHLPVFASWPTSFCPMIFAWPLMVPRFLWPLFLDSEPSPGPYLWAVFCRFPKAFAQSWACQGLSSCPGQAPLGENRQLEMLPRGKVVLSPLYSEIDQEILPVCLLLPASLPSMLSALFMEIFPASSDSHLLVYFFFPGNHGSGICCCSKTHFIFILTVSVLIARSAFIRLRITLSCMRTNK